MCTNINPPNEETAVISAYRVTARTSSGLELELLPILTALTAQQVIQFHLHQLVDVITDVLY